MAVDREMKTSMEVGRSIAMIEVNLGGNGLQRVGVNARERAEGDGGQGLYSCADAQRFGGSTVSPSYAIWLYGMDSLPLRLHILREVLFKSNGL